MRHVRATSPFYHGFMAWLLGGISSLSVWRDPALAERLCLDRPSAPLRTSPVEDPAPVLGALIAAGVDETGLVTVVVPRGSKRVRRKALETVEGEAVVPPSCYRRLTSSVCVASPEACFLLLARSRPLAVLAALGCELCGSYGVMRNGVGMFDRVPLTTASRLMRFLEGASGSYAVSRAKAAARFVVDGSASPQETRLYLMLCLPRRTGGYGFERPVMNRLVRVRPLDGRVVGRRLCYCDLYWPRARFGIEYDSHRYHEGYEAVDRDSKRRASLEASGVSVLSVTKGQVSNYYEMERIAKIVAKRLGVRARRGLFDRTTERVALHALLFGARRDASACERDGSAARGDGGGTGPTGA